MRMGSRRAHQRFQVVGVMPGTLQSTETLRFVNVGASGALVESPMPLIPNGEYRMQIVLESHVSETTVRIRRVDEFRPDIGAPRYRIGLEFLAISADAADVINRIVAAGGPGISADL